MCNGAGACRFWASGTQCAAGTCVGSTLTPQRTCDGAGVCGTVTSTLCDPYQCGSATACKTTCTSTAADCVSPNSCVVATMSCGKLPNGAACTAPAMCNSGFCAHGVCCSTACNTGICSSCALPGSLGVCSSVPAGQDPLNQCTDNGAASCGTDGSCNGSGGCRNYGAGTQCAAATCTGSTLTSARTCNGTGTCQPATTSSCMAYACGTGACRTTCTTNADCSGAPYVCVGTTCSSATNITVRLFGSASNPDWIYTTLQITNNGTTAIPLSDLTLRYWYSYDTTPIVAEADMCTYTHTPPAQCNNIIRTWVAVSPAKTNADRYYQIGFTAAAGNLNQGATAEFGLGWHKNDWSDFTQTNDYSYNAVTSFTTTTRVTAYRVGVLVYGTEPP
jgi:Cellulose binding domain